MIPGTRRIPEALLERYLAEALDGEARARLEALLADSPADRTRLAELRADSEAFLLKRPPGRLVARFQKQQRRWRSWRWPAFFLPALAAGLAALWVLLPPVEQPYTIKGSVVLALHRKVGNGVSPVSPEEPLAPGDEIRFEVKAPQSGFVAVLGKDARGVITVYHPYGGTAAAAYAVVDSELGAIRLDDTLGREDLYALHATSRFELEWAVRALEEGRSLEEAAPRGVAVVHTFITKQARPEQK